MCELVCDYFSLNYFISPFFCYLLQRQWAPLKFTSLFLSAAAKWAYAVRFSVHNLIHPPPPCPTEESLILPNPWSILPLGNADTCSCIYLTWPAGRSESKPLNINQPGDHRLLSPYRGIRQRMALPKGTTATASRFEPGTSRDERVRNYT